MRKIAILGSTGSIGTQTLEVVRANQDIQVAALAAGSNIVLLEKQIREFQPKLVCVWQEEQAAKLRGKIKDLSVQVVSGMEGLIQTAVVPQTELVVTAVVGMIGIRPTIAAIEEGKKIALANKETLVTAGHLIMPLAQKKQVSILPVDSEHSAVFQVLQGENKKEISRILLTASGGPFRGWTREEMEKIRPEDALKHPNWTMGKKITIDSATMVNKGLEVIEAKWLFGVDAGQIEVVVQPQSVIHSMVEFLDGGILAQLGTPDMKLPIQYALYYPQRRHLEGKRLDFAELGKITFEAPDLTNFRGLALAYQALERGGNIPTVLNAANELAVRRFLEGSIRFLEIPEIIEASMQAISYRDCPSVEQILETEQETYEWIESRW
ncbi:MAG: 1-deoxy-D-xylulose-5-phosphate reductoisomerase [Lachnospiraceae bacterium]|nr:1-deoxy-D-xylulose-5-phosphate reductoisomerase [Lachnospiraceae bacterium]